MIVDELNNMLQLKSKKKAQIAGCRAASRRAPSFASVG